jgi:type IV pilus assembly protein PilA
MRTHLTTALTLRLRKHRKQAGQGMTEYIIIVALIAVAAIAVTQLFGTTVRTQMGAIASEVGGNNASAAITKANTAGNDAVAAAAKKRSLSTYGDQVTTGSKGTQ